MYNAKVLEIFKNPKNVGSLKGANGIGTVGNAACGDIMKMYLKISDKGIIEDAKFKTFGCAAAITTTSVATELIKGKTIEEALKIKNSQIVDILGGLPTQKIHCSVLAEEAIHAAIEDYYKRKDKKNKDNKEEDDEE
jgi:nitrogen fixation NifU-like protein